MTWEVTGRFFHELTHSLERLQTEGGKVWLLFFITCNSMSYRGVNACMSVPHTETHVPNLQNWHLQC